MIYDLDEFEINIFLTRKCNLDCNHCYIDSNYRKSSAYIEKERVEDILDDLSHFFKINSFKVINIGIYGGEITQLDPMYINEIMDVVERKLKEYSPNTEVYFKAITNLITKDMSKYIDVFSRMSVVGISYDLDVNRFNKVNQRIWEESLVELQKIDTALTLNFTITNRVVGRESEFLNIIKKYNIESIHMGYYVPAGKNMDNGLRPTHRQHSDFCINMMELLHNNNLNNVEVSPVDAMVGALQREEFNGGVICEIFNTINIDTNGLISLCIAAGGNDSFPEQVVGDTNKDKISTILKSKKYYKELLSMLNPNEVCQDCEYQHLCKQGCKILSEFGVEDGECWGYKGLWDYVKKNINKLKK